ncbi:MAG: energy-coupling factor ABC transporter substrate-binding protein [Fervidobacterium sp.]
MKGSYLLLIVLEFTLVILPIFFIDGSFEGTDVQAEKLVQQINPDYKPWFSPIWEPPSSEIESLIFSIQSAIGSGIIFYIIGYSNGIKKKS